ncbi:MAG: hypothetical protein LBF91_01760, partial [Azoarcus sp.]|jgi:hypothetical protein|nr:hypothetical protein [Azoarcus sp.]
LQGRLLSEAVLPSFVERLNHEVDLRGRRFAALQVTAVPAKPAPDDSKQDERTALERSGWLEFTLRGEEAPEPVLPDEVFAGERGGALGGVETLVSGGQGGRP